MSEVFVSLEITGSQDCNEVITEVLLDGKLIVAGACSISSLKADFYISDDPRDHSLEIILSGKLPKHTQVGADGMIVNDVALTITKFEIENIDMIPIFCNGRACYTHSFNKPTGVSMQDEFYNYMGYNGTVRFDFYTPIYLWMCDYF